jgi:hypothetical protein
MNKLSYVPFAAALLSASPLSAQAAPTTTVIYQPMVSTGLAANEPFEAWFAFDKSTDPRVPGYAVPAGATIRFVFPEQFTPKKGLFLGAVMLQGWVQGPFPAKFTEAVDPNNPRAVTIKFEKPIGVAPPAAPGLKDIHLRIPVLNPANAGNYPIKITFADAGALSGTTTAVAHITPKPVPNIAATNDLSGGKDSNWQHVKVGQEAALPIDYLVTLPGVPRSVIALKPLPNGSLSILSDRKPIGSIKAQGVPVTMLPVAFGPGKARLGIIRIHVKAGNKPGNAEIIASLDHGTQYKITLVVDAATAATTGSEH